MGKLTLKDFIKGLNGYSEGNRAFGDGVVHYKYDKENNTVTVLNSTATGVLPGVYDKDSCKELELA